MTPKEQKLCDKIAIAAMSAIIAKLPLRSTDGPYEGAKEASAQERTRVCKAVAFGAYQYAEAMLYARKSFIAYRGDDE